MTIVRPRTPMVAAMLTAMLVLVPAIASAQANQLIINRAGAQQAAVTLTPDSNVSIDAVTGNVVVDCAPSSTNSTQCSDSLGGNNPPPAFTLASSNFNQPQTNGTYPALTTFTLAPVGLHADYEACQRNSTGVGATNWSGVLPASAATSSNVVLPNPDTTYTFSLRCFAATGARTSNVVSVLTAPGEPPPQGCQGITPPAGFNRTGERRFTDIRAQNGGFSSEWPRLGGLIVFAANRGEYVSVQFEATDTNFNDLLRLMDWIEAQGGGAGSASLNGVFFSISRCPGDFRIPTSVPSQTEPTLSIGCRNLTLVGGQPQLTGAMAYAINQPPSNTECSLALGGTYYMNFMTVNPLDGYQPNEHNCLDTTIPRCGVAFQSR